MKELPFGEEGLAEGIQEEAFTKAPGPGEEVELALVNELFDERSFVYVVVVFRADRLKTLDTNRKLLGHKQIIVLWPLLVKLAVPRHLIKPHRLKKTIGESRFRDSLVAIQQLET